MITYWSSTLILNLHHLLASTDYFSHRRNVDKSYINSDWSVKSLWSEPPFFGLRVWFTSQDPSCLTSTNENNSEVNSWNSIEMSLSILIEWSYLVEHVHPKHRDNSVHSCHDTDDESKALMMKTHSREMFHRSVLQLFHGHSAYCQMEWSLSHWWTDHDITLFHWSKSNLPDWITDRGHTPHSEFFDIPKIFVTRTKFFSTPTDRRYSHCSLASLCFDTENTSSQLLDLLYHQRALRKTVQEPDQSQSLHILVLDAARQSLRCSLL